jgi:ribA/ribD-fused uncharacterized protein
MNFEFFYGYYHPLSQWYRSEFFIENIRFTSAEQWMMYSKAKLFKDVDIASKILETDDPGKIRSLGRQVRGFKDQVWTLERESIVYTGNKEKFTQDTSLKSYLMSTGDSILAEASPSDLIWGIGFGEKDPNRMDQKKWKGKNLLGEILMKVRAELKI